VGADMKMQEIADRINAYLDKFENDPDINKDPKGRDLKPYYGAGAFYGSGRYIGVCYISYQGVRNLTKADALEYLEWLDTGNIGKHHKALSFNTRTGK
jgi:hypothetical protein